MTTCFAKLSSGEDDRVLSVRPFGVTGTLSVIAVEVFVGEAKDEVVTVVEDEAGVVLTNVDDGLFTDNWGFTFRPCFFLCFFSFSFISLQKNFK